MADIPQLIADTANAYGVSPALALEVGMVESNLNQSAISPKGAIGIFQLMPATAAGLGVNPHDLNQNIQGGVMLLQQLLQRFGDVTEALAAYNWNPTSVAAAIAKYGPNWLTAAPAETQAYVAKIITNLNTQYSVGPAAPPAPAPAPDTIDAGTPAADGSAVDSFLPGDLSTSEEDGFTSILILGALGLLLLFIFEET